MFLSPALHTSAPLVGGAALDVAGEPCLFCTPDAYPVVKGLTVVRWDIHCGFYDRRVTPVEGCSKFIPQSGFLCNTRTYCNGLQS